MQLVYSQSATRNNPIALSGSTLEGAIFAFLDVEGLTGIRDVRFFLDGEFVQRERNPPYDFAGGSVATANSFSTLPLSEGNHTIRAQINFNNGSSTSVTAEFTVDNIPAPAPDPDPNPDFSVTKTADVSAVANAGDVINYTISVENTGTQDLTAVSVDDPLLGGNLGAPIVSGDGDTILEVGETWTYRRSYTVTDGNINTNGGGDGDIDNTVTVDTDQTGSKQASVAVDIVQDPDPDPGTPVLKFSLSNDRSDPEILLDATVSNRIYPFLDQGNVPTSSISDVRFFLDGEFVQRERNAPYDFAGGSVATANSFSTLQLSEGNHTIRAQINFDNGSSSNVTAGFTVDNIPDPIPDPDPDPNPVPDPDPNPNPGIATDVDQVHLGSYGDLAQSITVVWRTPNTSVPSRVQYREQGSTTWQIGLGTERPSGTTGKLHEVTISSLNDSTEYEYRVQGADSKWSEIYTTETAPRPGGEEFTAVFVADTGLVGREDRATPTPGTQQIINEIAALDPNLVLGGGDYAYFKRDKRFGTLNNTIDEFFNQWEEVFSTSPFLPTYGNHEWDPRLDENIPDWAARVPVPETDGVFRDVRQQKGNYSYDVGDAHFLSLFMPYETQSFTDRQLNWIEDDILAAQQRGQEWIIPYFHSGPIGDGTRHPRNVNIRPQIGSLFEELDVDLVLFAHDQAFERTFPLVNLTENSQTPTSTSLDNYTKDDGTIYAKVSPGGKLRFSEFSTSTIPDFMAVRNNTLFSYSELSITEDLLRMDTYGVTGDGSDPILMDSFRISNSSSQSVVQAASFDELMSPTPDTFI